MSNTDRIARLKEKIEGVKVTLESKKETKIEKLSKRLDSLDEKLKNSEDTKSTILGSMDSDVIIIQIKKFSCLKLSNI